MPFNKTFKKGGLQRPSKARHVIGPGEWEMEMLSIDFPLFVILDNPQPKGGGL